MNLDRTLLHLHRMKRVLLTMIFLGLSAIILAQTQDTLKPKHPPRDYESRNPFDWKKVFFGGNIGLQFGNITIVDISPRIGYKFTERISSGIGGTYQYLNYPYYNFTTNIYGGRVFAQAKITELIFAYGEYELLSVERFDILGGRIAVENIYGGLGLRQPIGPRSSYFIMALWNFNQSRYSLYSNPLIRMGFNIGF